MAMMKRAMVGAWLVVALAAAGCGTKRVNVCNADTDCKDPSFPFCDVNGQYPASGGEKNGAGDGGERDGWRKAER